MLQFRYRVQRDGGRVPYTFDIMIWAETTRASEIQAAEIGMKLGILLIGPR